MVNQKTKISKFREWKFGWNTNEKTVQWHKFCLRWAIKSISRKKKQIKTKWTRRCLEILFSLQKYGQDQVDRRLEKAGKSLNDNIDNLVKLQYST